MRKFLAQALIKETHPLCPTDLSPLVKGERKKLRRIFLFSHMQNHNHFNLLDVRIDNLSKKETLEKVKYFLSEKNFCRVATVNPEFILLAQKDGEFKKIINRCDLNIADGFGIKLAFWKSGKNLKSRITGVDLMLEILKIASQNKDSIFLAANKNGLSNWKETRDAILKIYPDLEISGADLDLQSVISAKAAYLSGLPDGKASRKGIQRNKQNLIKNIGSRFHGNDIGENKNNINNIYNYDILFCNFGAPFQEKFINLLKNGNMELAMGVGGSFDFITGKIKRAPLWVRNIGMEWLWRLILQPKRFKRIFNSVVVFMWKVIFKKII